MYMSWFFNRNKGRPQQQATPQYQPPQQSQYTPQYNSSARAAALLAGTPYGNEKPWESQNGWSRNPSSAYGGFGTDNNDEFRVEGEGGGRRRTKRRTKRRGSKRRKTKTSRRRGA